MGNTTQPKSSFVERLYALERKWEESLPWDRRAEFSRDMSLLAYEHDRDIEKYSRDQFTGLPLPTLIYENLSLLIREAKEGKVPIAGILFVDLVEMKKINDRFGHDAGNAALKYVAEVLNSHVRHRSERRIFDDLVRRIILRTPNQMEGYAGRWGGDEFLVSVYLKKVMDIEKILERINRHINIESLDQPKEAGMLIRVSIGAVEIPLPIEVVSLFETEALVRDLVKVADEQMYNSKRTGKVHVAYAQLQTDDPSEPLKVVTKLVRAFE